MAWDIGFDQTESSSSSSSRSSSSSSSSLSSSSSSRSSSSSSSRSSSSSSSSFASTAPGTVVWGHHTSVDEVHDRNFTSNWTVVTWTISGVPGTDDETIDSGSGCGQVSIGEDWNLGVMEAVIKVDKYQTGSGPAPIIHYITAATQAGLLIGSWTLYNGVSFTSLGWIKLRITHT